MGDGHVFMIDLAFHKPIHGGEEILAVIQRVESEDIRAEHAE